jgi:hypothetical protein
VTPDGQRIVTVEYGGPARVWDAVSGRELRKIDVDSHAVSSIAITPDGQRLATGSGDCTAKLLDAVAGRELLTLKGHTGTVVAVAFTPDGQRLVTGSFDGTAKLWDAHSGRELLTLKGPSGEVLSVAVMPDGQRLITGYDNGTATVWDTASGQELCSLKGHTGAVWSLAVTADSERIITGSADDTARLWDAVSGRELLTLKGHTGAVSAVALIADGRRLITGSVDGTAKIWEAASPEQITLWDRQDEEASRRLATWQRPIASAPGFIRDWVVLAPLALEAGQSGAEGLEHEQFEGEAKLRPGAGEHVQIGGREYIWQAYHAEESVLDFIRFMGKMSEHCVAYAVCYVISEAERQDLLLQVGSDDQAKVYLNGQEVYKYTRPRSLVALDPIGPVALRKGRNVLVFKVVNEGLHWLGCLRFVDAKGSPAHGLRVSLTPE